MRRIFGLVLVILAMGSVVLAITTTGLEPTVVKQEKSLTVSTEKRLEQAGAPKPMVANLGAGVTMELLPIAAGSFLMGSKRGHSDEKPVHQVTISQPFWMAKTEVTQAQYQQVMGQNPSNFKGAENPVEKVTWNDAMAFCKKLTKNERQSKRLPEGFEYTLPTEAQWEYTCRAGTTGDHAGRLVPMAWYVLNAEDKTQPVGTKMANPWGLHDMHGNVREWCRDVYAEDFYKEALVPDPVNTGSGSFRVFRGGGWYDDSQSCRSSYRGRLSPSDSAGDLGFRAVLARNTD